MLVALAKSPYIKSSATIFDSMLDDPVLDPGKVSSSSLDAIHYGDAEIAEDNAGCHAHKDKGLLTIVFADKENGLQVPKLKSKLQLSMLLL